MHNLASVSSNAMLQAKPFINNDALFFVHFVTTHFPFFPVSCTIIRFFFFFCLTNCASSHTLADHKEPFTGGRGACIRSAWLRNHFNCFYRTEDYIYLFCLIWPPCVLFSERLILALDIPWGLDAQVNFSSVAASSNFFHSFVTVD